MRLAISTIVALALLSISCEPRHIRAHTVRERRYQPGQYASDEEGNAPGSLWKSSTPSLFEDLRASRLGDILTVNIDEESKGQGNAKTN